MTVRYHIPTRFISRNQLSSDETARLQSVITEAISRAVSAAASSASESVLSDEEPEAVVEFFSSDRYRSDRETYAIPSYDDQGRPQEVPIDSPGGPQTDAAPTSAPSSDRTQANPPVSNADLLAAAPGVQTFEQTWREFNNQLDLSHDQEAMALVPDLLARMSVEDAMKHGRSFALWLLNRGQRAQAESVFDQLESAWWLRFSVGDLPRRNFIDAITDDPHVLTESAMALARRGNHDEAFRLFGLAFLFSQMQLDDRSARREEELKKTEARLAGHGAERFSMAESMEAIFRGLAYQDIGSIMELMRQILGFYPSLEREAQAAGNQTLAAQFSSLGFVLRMELRDRYTMTGARGWTMESSQAMTPHGVGYTIYGAQGVTEIVTPLPGTRTPEELGFFPPYTSPMEELLEIIAGQEEFLTALNGHPEIRAAFGTRRINMSDLEERLRVWRIMYRIFQRESSNPLNALLRFMENYLKYFTRHTEYNIRDFGVSYLSTEFPEDLAGRAVRDCGVYALTVAYEVYRTARGATPPLALDFQLYAMPEHVTLAIIDKAGGNYYLVNNDHIESARQGDVGQSLARAYAKTFQRQFAVTPVMRVDLGSTNMSNAAFRTTAWQRYLVSTQWGLRPEAPTGPDDTRTEDERAQAIYQTYYEAAERFDIGSQNLQARLNALAQSLTNASAAARNTQLQAQLPELTQLGVALAIIFDAFSRNDLVNVRNARARALLDKDTLYSYHGSETHPLPRLAMALLHFESLGNTLNNEQQELLSFLRRVRRFRSDLETYISRGKPPTL